MRMRFLLSSLLVPWCGLLVAADSNRLSYLDCLAYLQNDTLVVQNSRIRRSFVWNSGHLMTVSLQDRLNRTEWPSCSLAPDCFWPGAAGAASHGALLLAVKPATPRLAACLEVTVTAVFDSFSVKRIFRIYPDCPAIACDYYIKGELHADWLDAKANSDALESVEFLSKFDQHPRIPVLDRLALGGPHWQVSAVRFFDRTDVNNNLVEEQTFLTFLKWRPVAGNILFAQSTVNKQVVFMLKEAPCSDVQLAYPGADFISRNGEFLAVGPGVTPADLSPDSWLRCYSLVVGVSAGDKRSQRQALRTYQDHIRIRKPERDLMIMMNTWGDRNRDARLGEAFALRELQAGHRLGISHFQLDDGWQSGISKNSAFGQGSWQDNWGRRDYWQVHPEKFPNGLAPVLTRGKELGIEICLWFNPSSQDQYKNWQVDADAMIALYKAYGIRTFKIDGVFVPDKPSEINFRNMLERVMAATGEEAVFNLDVTAGRRFGYHYFTEYGNLFLENRYTDWANYYPHWTMRNIWMLSRYLPPQSLQIEFLNKWRNEQKYAATDVLAPRRIPFAYMFAVTMVGQPLAWFEASGLPEEAFDIAPLIKSYRKIQRDLHACQIFPIGDEPSGTSWTGFQAVAGQEGFLLVFREDNANQRQWMATLLDPGIKVRCRAITGSGKDFSGIVDPQGRLSFTLPDRFSYALYHYSAQ
jgi:hypothetical protein